MDIEYSEEDHASSAGLHEELPAPDGDPQALAEDAQSEGTEVSGEEGDESSEGGEEGKKRPADRKVKLFDERYFEVEEEPPKLVVVQGPPQSGKTTLIKCLIKHYTKQSVQDPRGELG